MKKGLVVLLSLLSVVAYGRKKEVNVTKSEIVIGKFADSTSINATVYTFPERIHEAFVDTVFECLTVQTRGIKKEKWLENKGDIIQYSLTEDRVLWDQRINYQTENVDQGQGHLMFTSGGKSHGIDHATGDNTWESRHVVFVSLPKDNRAIGYHRSIIEGVSMDRLECFDTNNGNVLWKRKISRAFGWDIVGNLTDSVVLIQASGLYAVNIFTGEGWGHDAITGTKDFKTTRAANAVGAAAGITLGILTGVFAIPMGGHDLVSDLCSNCLIDSSSIYMAFADHIAKINQKTGEVEWSDVLSKDFASMSRLFVIDDNLYMINSGTARLNGRETVDCGIPFVACYNINTGDRKYLKTISQNGDPIKGLDINKDGLLKVLFQSRISYISLSTGDVIKERVYDKEQTTFVGELSSRICIVDDNGKYQSIAALEKGKFLPFTKDGIVYVFDDNQEITGEYSLKGTSQFFMATPTLRFFAKRGDSTVVVDKEGNVVATLDINTKVRILNNKLYQVRGNQYIVVDLNQLEK